jgi:histidine ammonia-lyase
MTNLKFYYGQDELTLTKALALADGSLQGAISEDSKKKIIESQKHVEDIVQRNETVYGINTGFGPMCNTAISAEDTSKLQDNLLRSHSVGVGDPIPEQIAKLMLILKVHSLCFGFSGIHPNTLERMLWLIDSNIVPVVPKQGSVGASGDLAPLAHLALPLIGLGKVHCNGKIIESAKALKQNGLEPIVLGPKEGLALINGTQFIAAFATHVASRLHNCLDSADIIGALSLEAMLGSGQPFKEKLHALRPHPGAQYVASRLRTLLKDSGLVASHSDCDRVQDPYSMRCMPQVHGASRDAWRHLNERVLCEINSVTDNPIIFADETISGGNFHGEPLALPLDYACLAASEIGSISERRTYLMLEGKFGLPTLLMKDTGINSGFMIPQYTAAALASENKTLCFPASADSIPTSIGQEDHVSMGSISGRKAYQVLDNLENILAVELLCAAQAFDFRRPLKSSTVLESCHELVREKITHAEDDRLLGEDMAKACDIIAKGELIQTANKAAKDNGLDLLGQDFTNYHLI